MKPYVGRGIAVISVKKIPQNTCLTLFQDRNPL